MKRPFRIMQIFALVAACLMSSAAMAQWQGTWDTTWGEVKLQQTQKYVYGDYGTWGTIEGLVSKDRRTVRGVYKRNDDGSSGYFEWQIVSTEGFSGRWSKPQQALPVWNKTGTSWTGTRKSSAKPRLTVYRGNGNIGTFMGAQQARYQRWASALFSDDYKSAPSPTRATRSLPTGYDPAPAFTPSKLKTAFELQRHVQAISKTNANGKTGEQNAIDAYRRLGWELLGGGIINETGTDKSKLRAAVAKKGDAIVVTFRGTGGDNTWETFKTGVLVDARIRKAPPLYIPQESRNNAKVHTGFLTAYQQLRPQILNALKGQKDTHLFVTGHSLGGAMAQLMAWDMAVNHRSDFKTITNITSGAPRVGDAAFKLAYESTVTDNLRIIVNRDPVPTIPWKDGDYVHAGKTLVIGLTDGVLLQHKDHQVRASIWNFGTYHDNVGYYNAVRMLADRAPNNSRLSPNGGRWARDAAKSWYELSKEKPGRIRERAKGLVDKARGVFRK